MGLRGDGLDRNGLGEIGLRWINLIKPRLHLDREGINTYYIWMEGYIESKVC